MFKPSPLSEMPTQQRPALPPGFAVATFGVWLGAAILFISSLAWVWFSSKGYVPGTLVQVMVGASAMTILSMCYGIWSWRKAGPHAAASTMVLIAPAVATGMFVVIAIVVAKLVPWGS